MNKSISFTLGLVGAALLVAGGVSAEHRVVPGPRLVRPGSSAATHKVPSGFLPDPRANASRRQWHYKLFYYHGKFISFRPVLKTYKRPRVTPRKMGRYAVELYIGHHLLERVRFDLPFAGNDPWAGKSKRPYHAPPSLAAKLTITTEIEVPDLERATYVLLVDRATHKRQRLFWPPMDDPIKKPVPTIPAASSSAVPKASSSGSAPPPVAVVPSAKAAKSPPPKRR
jgi:hypothetical protein